MGNNHKNNLILDPTSHDISNKSKKDKECDTLTRYEVE